MGIYDNENKIIESFQEISENKVCLIPDDRELNKIFNLVYNKEEWKKWIDSSSKSAPPPDFYNETNKIMMDVMRIDDHAYENEKGKIINPTLQKENKIYKELINSNFIKDINFMGNIFINAKTELPSELDHNYIFYYKNFNRVIEKHIKSIDLYRKNHPNFKIIFFIFDESSAYFEAEKKISNKKVGMNVKGNIHFWFLDKKFINEIIKSKIDYLIWYAPNKHYIGTNDEMIPKICVYNVKELKENIAKDYDELKMESIEI